MSQQQSAAYFVPQPSAWPVIGSVALFLMGLGAGFAVNDIAIGKYLLGSGFAVLIYLFFGWFGMVIGESERGLYGKQVDMSFRWSMGWFIYSEVMFFAAFFGALYYVRVISVPELSSIDSKLIWPAFTGHWPMLTAPFNPVPYSPMHAIGLPLLNTALLLTSGVTLTIAHHGLLANHRKVLIGWLAATVALGVTFLCCQATEYHEAYTHLGLTLKSGVYGATFFMLTGFHGMHVLVGSIMLLVMLGRSIKGHFTPERHFAFEAAAWYWHFVDVVWLLLFIFVYAL